MLNRYFAGSTDATSPAAVARWGKRPYRDRLVERFWSYVDKTPGQGPKGECWEWTGSRLGPKGEDYGLIGVKLRDGSYRPRHAHILSYEINHGEIPNRFYVCHRCDNPPCVNPDHLWAGSGSDNTRDAQQKGRIPIAQTRALKRFYVTQALAIRIKLARTNLGLSQRKVSRMTGGCVESSYISYIERGLKSHVKRDKLASLCTALKINVAILRDSL